METRRGATMLLTLAVGCAPSLDWREVWPEGSEAVVLFPCKPSHYARRVMLAGEPVTLALSACVAADATWALAHADVVDPARVGAALEALREAAAANVAAAASSPLPLRVPGATPNPRSVRLAMGGRLPDGKAVQEQVAVFAHGTRVFQATVLSAALPSEAADTFFGSLRFGP
jgi:hypothetical protein